MEWRICSLTKLFRREESSNCFSLLYVSPVGKNSKRWTKSFELLLPVEKSAVRSNNQKWSPDTSMLWNMSKKSNGLNCLSQTHFISKNSINTLLKEIVEPSQSLDLIFFESSMKGLRSMNKLEFSLVNRWQVKLSIFFLFLKFFHIFHFVCDNLINTEISCFFINLYISIIERLYFLELFLLICINSEFGGHKMRVKFWLPQDIP